jgi:transposase InsO family protein
MDFVSDQLYDGRKLRALTLIDAYTRKCLAIWVDQRIRGEHVVTVVDTVRAERGAPRRIHVDNGPEFVSKVLDRWAYERQVELAFSRPGKPTDNAFIEAFNGRLRQRHGHPAPSGVRIEQRYTHEELANMIGSTRQRVTTTLKQFAKSGLVKSDGQCLTLSDPDGLRKLVRERTCSSRHRRRQRSSACMSCASNVVTRNNSSAKTLFIRTGWSRARRRSIPIHERSHHAASR